MDEGKDTVRRRLVFSGFVQGVGFRYWAIKSAASFDVAGYVRNLPDGRVETVVEGPRSEVDRFYHHLRQGPPYGRVSGVDVIEEEPRGGLAAFEVRY